MNLLFVYGTLRKGGKAHDQFLRSARCLGQATVKGTLYRVSWYPAFVADSESKERVMGEVYEVDSRLLQLIDEFEEIEADLKTSEYRRELVWVDLNGSPVEVWAYVYNRNFQSLEIIKAGDWLRA